MDDEPEPAAPARVPETTRIVAGILIVLIASLSAAATWRAEIAGTSAATVQHQAVVETIDATTTDELAYTQAAQDASLVGQVQALTDDGSESAGTALAAATMSSVGDALGLTYAASWEFRRNWFALGYLRDRARTGVDLTTFDTLDYDLDAAAGSIVAGSQVRDDSAETLARAERSESLRTHLLQVALVLVVALVCATYGQLTSRPKAARRWLVAGTVGLGAAAVLFTWTAVA